MKLFSNDKTTNDKSLLYCEHQFTFMFLTIDGRKCVCRYVGQWQWTEKKEKNNFLIKFR